VDAHARVKFDGNRYSTSPDVARKTAVLRASATQVRVLYQGREVACHARCYDRGQFVRQPAHQLEALQRRGRQRARQLEGSFDALGEAARQFHLALRQRPVKTRVHLRRLLHLVRLYGRPDVVAAIARANAYQTFDAAYVETLLLQERRRRELPSPTQVRPQREELVAEIELDEPDPGAYDRFCDGPGNPDNPEEEENESPPTETA
jgi:hypothetical protein